MSKNKLHINSVKVHNIWVSYDIQNVNDELQIVATFTKEGNRIHSIYNISFSECRDLFDRDYAIKHAETMINDSNKSKHSPFL